MVPISAGRKAITPTTQPTLDPTPTKGPLKLVVTDAPLQYWSDPNGIRGIVRDGDSVWTATGAGVMRWDRDGQVVQYGTDEGLASHAVRGIALDGQRGVWVGFADNPSWCRFSGGGWHTYGNRTDAVESHYQALLSSVHMDPHLWYSRSDSDWVWIPEGTGSVQAYDGERWRTYTAYNGIVRDAYAVVVSESGRVWAVGNGVSTAEEGDVWWTDHTLFSGIASHSAVTDVDVDAEGALWLAFTGAGGGEGGLARVQREGDSVRWRGFVHSVNPQILEQAYAMTLDSEGTVWLGGDGGLVRYRPGRPWEAVLVDDLNVRSIAKVGGELWLGSTNGLWHAREDGTELVGPWRVPSPLTGQDTRFLGMDMAGDLYLAMSDHLMSFTTDGTPRVVLEADILCLVEGPQKRLWVGTTEGLYELTADGPRLSWEGAVRAAGFDAQGAAYVCDDRGVLSRVDGSLAPTDLSALVNAMPRNMVIDSQGTIWFASENGLGALAADGEFTHYTEDNGPLSRDVRCVALGSEDTIWLATDYGLARRLSSGRWTRFTTKSTEGGLLSHDMWAVYVDAQDVLWMATAGGISYRTPEIDWANMAIAEARAILPTERGVWVGTPSGLYLAQKGAMTVMP